MKFSYNWLNDYFGGKLPEAEILAEKIGLHAFELEGIEKSDSGDFLIDWDILPNRSSDCLCYEGIVKEISTILNLKNISSPYEEKLVFSSKIKTSDFIKLKIDDNKKVLRATKRIAVNVKVGESPTWLVERLKAMGQKSINNVVDITNYVMWVTGQPVHAFDYDKLAGDSVKNIYIRPAKNGEKIKILSGENYELDDKIIVIADDDKPLDIAGIKGGEVSGVDEDTTKILMSAVNFEYENIRNTSRKLKLQTDASKRYENEVPLYKVMEAQDLFGSLLQKLTGADISEEVLDTKQEVSTKLSLKINTKKINLVLGTNLKEDDIIKIIDRLKFDFEKDNGFFKIKPAADRLDLKLPEDIIEEIGRVYGYENIETKFPQEGFKIPKINVLKKSRDTINDILTSLNFYEIYNRTIVKNNSKNNQVELNNSLNANATCLRNNLLDELKERVQKNLNYSDEPRLFEIGKIFTKDNKFQEYYSFAGMIGRRKIKEKDKENIFYQTKGVLEKVFEVLKIKNIKWEKSKDEKFVADLLIDKEIIGSVGLNFWEINIEKLIKNIKHKIEYRRPSKYPKIERDIAFWVPINLQVIEVQEIINKELPREAKELLLFDIYKDEGGHRKSFAFKIIFQSEEKTLSDEFVNKIMDNIYKKLTSNNFEIR